MKQVLLSFLIYLLLTSITYADNTDLTCLGSNNYTTFSEECNDISGYDLYECRVKNLCTPCGKGAKKIFKTEKYEEATSYEKTRKSGGTILDPFKAVQKKYKSDMNSIYKCVLIDIQVRGMELIEKIISATDKTGLVKKELQTKISSEKTKLKAKKAALKCGGDGEDNSKEKIIKKEVLDQVSLEFCTYSYYLLYLREYYTQTQKALLVADDELESTSSTTDVFTTYQVTSNVNTINNTINTELIRINKVFPLAYYAYSEYEDNYALHLLLTLIKQDYMLVVDQLAQVLGPLNQLAYKIKDAAKKY